MTPEEQAAADAAAKAAEDAKDKDKPSDKTFDPDAWYTALTDEQRQEIDAYHNAKTTGQQSALVKERDAAKVARELNRELEKQAADLAAKAEGAEKAAAEKWHEQLKTANDRADFYADVHLAGASDTRLAWAAVREYELYDRKGNPDIEALKEKCPYLFKPATIPTPRTNAGTGTGQPAATSNDFNTNLRKVLDVG